MPSCANGKMKPNRKTGISKKQSNTTGLMNPQFYYGVKLKMNPFIWIQGRDKFSEWTRRYAA